MTPIDHYFAAILQDGDWLNDWLTHIPTYAQALVLLAGRLLQFMVQR
jgi:hypothetical protein